MSDNNFEENREETVEQKAYNAPQDKEVHSDYTPGDGKKTHKLT